MFCGKVKEYLSQKQIQFDDRDDSRVLPAARLAWSAWVGRAERLGAEFRWLVSRSRGRPAGRRIRSVISGTESVQKAQPIERGHAVGCYRNRSCGHPFSADDRKPSCRVRNGNSED